MKVTQADLAIVGNEFPRTPFVSRADARLDGIGHRLTDDQHAAVFRLRERDIPIKSHDFRKLGVDYGNHRAGMGRIGKLPSRL